MDFEHEVWGDWCVETYGPLDLEENMRANVHDCPEGFIWSCCRARGANNPGCRRGPHQAREISIKRVRV